MTTTPVSCTTSSTTYPPDGPIPPEFANCEYFKANHDWKYFDCDTHGGDVCYLLKEAHRAKDFRKYFLAYIPVGISVAALILNSLFLAIQIYQLRTAPPKRIKRHRKRYLFLLSRTISTLFALIMLYIVFIVWMAGAFDYATTAMLMFCGGVNVLSITGTYIFLSLLLFTAIIHPIFYRTRVTMRLCIALIIINWTCCIISSIFIGLYGATLFYPDSTPVKCDFHSCQKPLAIFIVCGLSVAYVSVLGIYGVLLIWVHRRFDHTTLRNSFNERHQVQMNVSALNRLSMNMITFALGSIPILAVCITALVQLESLSTLGEGCKSPCKTFENGALYVQVEVLASIAAIVWLSAMTADPIINTTADQNLRVVFMRGYRYTKRRLKHHLHIANEEDEEDEDAPTVASPVTVSSQVFPTKTSVSSSPDPKEITETSGVPKSVRSSSAAI